jgi:hypothetical protein
VDTVACPSKEPGRLPAQPYLTCKSSEWSSGRCAHDATRASTRDMISSWRRLVKLGGHRTGSAAHACCRGTPSHAGRQPVDTLASCAAAIVAADPRGYSAPLRALGVPAPVANGHQAWGGPGASPRAAPLGAAARAPEGALAAEAPAAGPWRRLSAVVAPTHLMNVP